MKAATVPSPDETQVPYKQVQREFMARGLAARKEAMPTGEYDSADDILGDLDAMLSEAERKASK